MCVGASLRRPCEFDTGRPPPRAGCRHARPARRRNVMPPVDHPKGRLCFRSSWRSRTCGAVAAWRRRPGARGGRVDGRARFARRAGRSPSHRPRGR
ncbi:hypothetical protein C7S16_6907 [Burkholderia thailandensis]|uniref:Uncharacterized protein n=1 Tax=Burkholderia thailandensis TaxID=57975 RepID=A0AAW9CKM2_BURTH|nr:hypothetical protein [Burkholderia thailandensis]MDW9250792.1 hypothetical protein [Burkholderia thailandensis]